MQNPSPKNRVPEDPPKGAGYKAKEEISRYGVQRLL